jgi:hypothetical protein
MIEYSFFVRLGTNPMSLRVQILVSPERAILAIKAEREGSEAFSLHQPYVTEEVLTVVTHKWL